MQLNYYHSSNSFNTKQVHSQTKKTYNNINDGEGCDCGISSKICISNKGSDERSDVASPRPVGDIVRSCGAVLVETLLEIHHKIRAHPIECQPFAAFVPFLPQTC